MSPFVSRFKSGKIIGCPATIAVIWSRWTQEETGCMRLVIFRVVITLCPILGYGTSAIFPSLLPCFIVQLYDYR
ncbi:unnamed protein product [Acanthoscelides obtectus]|uniref:Uncharacterized protein n=1 Tax=Acanthoscelides obtectus TaxID=200917 RepID=A0A9P0Q4R0_ACAOB|nr:unnamed protein product [Acanthoscelides obtectus]CAK1624334.1 hypothetical protein AOBTE_LOCUS2505 [Acanthoscelides obtectus]